VAKFCVACFNIFKEFRKVLTRLIRYTDKVEFSLQGSLVTAKGSKGSLSVDIHADINIAKNDGKIELSSDASKKAILGTMTSLVNNAVIGVSKGYSKHLELRGVGYRAQLKGNSLNLTLGYSHPVVYDLPEGISADLPNQTNIILKGIDKQLVGQVAAEIRSFRKVEPYKGKGIRYSSEHVVLKDTKKK
jgi:large subunit ribosomal protein L6